MGFAKMSTVSLIVLLLGLAVVVDATGSAAVQEAIFHAQQTEMRTNAQRLLRGEFNEQRQHNAMLDAGPEELCVNAQWHKNLPWPWFVYKPTWNCHLRERIGEVFDGGKYHCNLAHLRLEPNCVAYSFGSNGIIEYETQLRERTGCEVHIFDPTVTDDRIPVMPPGIVFHKMGVAGTAGTVTVGGNEYPAKPLADIMRELGHAHLNVLKIDVDGYEYDMLKAMPDLLANQVDELLLEIHWKGLELSVELMESILHAGFRIFNHEPNLFYIALPAAGIEYSFIHNRVAMRYNARN